MPQEDVIIQPRKGKNERSIPAYGVMLITPTEADYGHSLLKSRNGSEVFIHHSKLTVDAAGSLFVAGPAVGAPIAAMTLEKLIALGARKIVMFGWCGAASNLLQVGDVLVGRAGVIGEGTSQYYNKRKVTQPSTTAAESVAAYLRTGGIEVKTGNVWSTDAPYRESRRKIAELIKDDNVVGVDMEYSALCSVSSFREIDFAGVFLVSDELYHSKWRPGFRGDRFKKTNRLLVRLLTNCE